MSFSRATLHLAVSDGPQVDRCDRVWAQLLTEEGGQDVIEYALLGALIGIASILTWQQIAARTGVVYGEADAGVQGISACTPDPGGGGCP